MHRKAEEERVAALPATTTTQRGADWAPRSRQARSTRHALALVDLDDTLVDRAAGFRLWATRFVADRGLAGEALAWLVRTDRAVRERSRFFALVHEYFETAASAADLWDDYRARMPSLAPLFPGVLEALTRLRDDGWRLGVVTNGRTDNQLGKLRHHRLVELLDGWWISEEVGVRKPDPAIFRVARNHLDPTGTAECWMVGDDPRLDIAGGRSSGLRTVWVSHGLPWPLADHRPDLIGDSPAEALALLHDPGRRPGGPR